LEGGRGNFFSFGREVADPVGYTTLLRKREPKKGEVKSTKRGQGGPN